VTVTTALAIYFVVWWVVLFAVLPWGVRSQGEEGEVAYGTDPGAPAVPRLWSKLGWTTVISALVFAVGWYLAANGILTFERLSLF
jgi:predicted secreted protein